MIKATRKLVVAALLVLLPTANLTLAYAEGRAFTKSNSIWELGERVSGVPAPIIYGIALSESGIAKKSKKYEPHPWTLNSPVGPMYFNSRKAAEIALMELLKTYTNVDIGLMQVNWGQNGKYYVDDPRELLDPKVNLIAAGFILKVAYQASNGDLKKTIARYHTWKDEQRGREYANGVMAKIAKTY